MLRRVRWSVLSWFRAEVRESSEGMEGQDIALDEGSIERGSRVNVESMLVEGSGCVRKAVVRVQNLVDPGSPLESRR